jgi:myo-inositol-hexaphosphate 3-phosphohydrolase
LKGWSAHFHPKGFHLIGAGYHIAVVVREHHHGFTLELRIKDFLTGDVEGVTVYQGQHGHSRK